ncbi:GNAT family N-acetyltransferase [Clostridioides sp. ES-S-0005-03]|uniref:GNAT family N-acetyltransferase n=1 Tax=Clostridioides sp. ES-S-0005-03 TaxID=2770774 RepID=UPI001D0F84DC|nr:GNAT family N-acetyltransferase [Clostridioides sp. ES-S-0005-03]UDN48841.1 GNAT family N-acetyltransferase [Clostridioides sp. ES-S-0173-01]
MRFERLRTYEDKLYLEAIKLYNVSFPFHEQRNPSLQAEIMGHEEYQFNLIYDENDMVGIILCWETENFIYVEHFCINPEMRNKKYGKRALELLNQRGKTVILEIDPPINKISIKRQGFYERVGYKVNDFEYIHPPYHEECNGHQLILMSYPETLTKVEYGNFNQYLRRTVMGL